MSNDNTEKQGTVRQIALLFTVAFFIACPLIAWYTGELKDILDGWFRILMSPSPSATDYYLLGGAASAFLNAGACGAVFTAFMYAYKLEDRTADLAGYFLVVAHCFYGLNFLNMWPPVLGILLYCKVRKQSFRENISTAMFSTAFGPFIGELIHRYPLLQWDGDIMLGTTQIGLTGIIGAAVLGVFLGFTIPAALPSAYKLHRGFNLYNAGLAFGLLGMFISSFMYRTMGVDLPAAVEAENEAYAAHGNSYADIVVKFFLIIFIICIIRGLKLEGGSLKNYRELLKDSGYKTNFLQKYGDGAVWINIGFYGIMVLTYFTVVVIMTEGAGFTGPTCGVILASLSFSAAGQHCRNTWPIMAGYALLFGIVCLVSLAAGEGVPWTLSTQGYINGLAFATGLCPIAGYFGYGAGIAAGFVSAVLCTSTSMIHSGLVLYNGGFTAGLSALILLPILDHYFHKED